MSGPCEQTHDCIHAGTVPRKTTFEVGSSTYHISIRQYYSSEFPPLSEPRIYSTIDTHTEDYSSAMAYCTADSEQFPTLDLEQVDDSAWASSVDEWFDAHTSFNEDPVLQKRINEIFSETQAITTHNSAVDTSRGLALADHTDNNDTGLRGRGPSPARIMVSSTASNSSSSEASSSGLHGLRFIQQSHNLAKNQEHIADLAPMADPMDTMVAASANRSDAAAQAEISPKFTYRYPPRTPSSFTQPRTSISSTSTLMADDDLERELLNQL